jgi:hypothetical protein
MARRKDMSFEIDSSWVGRLFEMPVKTVNPNQTSPNERNSELEAIRDRVELTVTDSVSRFRHPNDLVLLAIAEGNEDES